ncbi:ABC transporter ATP-binding protein [Paraburkholderia domus]|uniref:ABC transporter ATP-binding protein YejF n=1 Tax=Paraburkholderia domus TaxID=2793075 RepID=A0A9N8MVD6_9BURK|nr:dipeptide ABC transporter ATP-binding protein [Paraburkholderia domus]MBK5050064.1 ABC transporter ATP-binding protein [Burkholderia sp. R-70006]MBK5064242.1 ABC transporter ATP-binding protein [Burkholderia sp. R-70199]MBK5121522.1 ABC transporter ATP-binding protein [Burkholderia sp. R-69980]MBK5166665.1 ABC transporter ATP-binding protein [Burkholderia sp. R-70211]MBK5185347.1 ABC transporter ATP-binding protein [Burkholderia sp. R-69749]MCI0147194.1 dipeptide ABC transporter ATP-bindin
MSQAPIGRPLLEIDRFSVRFGDKIAVHELSLSIARGERVALVGESGSGKSVTALSILRLVEHAELSGRMLLDGEDLLQKTEQQMRGLRGADVAMVFQEPMTALNPLFTIGKQIAESLRLHEGLRPNAARQRGIELLRRTGIPEPERRIDSFPHQLSGGQRQRAMIAMALACRPRLLLADEPTTALDVTVRQQIVDLLIALQEQEAAERGMAVLLITHDLNLVKRFAQRVAVMEKGVLVETNTTEALFSNPQHPYTQRLLDSEPQRAVEPVEPDARPLLDVRGLAVDYSTSAKGWRSMFGRSTFRAVHDVDLSVRRGETLGIVGESGSGKSTLAATVLGLQRPAAGHIHIDGLLLSTLKTARSRRALYSRMQVVFQDPFGSLSPRMTVEQIIGEGLTMHQPDMDAKARRARIGSLLEEVGMPADAMLRYPHEFSGGQRQRIAIARALAVEPELLVLDEPTSALDVSIQKQVLNLLTNLQKKYKLSYLFITHDLAVMRAMAHRVIVMKSGRIVEAGDTLDVLHAPSHPYTQSLLASSLIVSPAGATETYTGTAND